MSESIVAVEADPPPNHWSSGSTAFSPRKDFSAQGKPRAPPKTVASCIIACPALPLDTPLLAMSPPTMAVTLDTSQFRDVTVKRFRPCEHDVHVDDAGYVPFRHVAIKRRHLKTWHSCRSQVTLPTPGCCCLSRSKHFRNVPLSRRCCPVRGGDSSHHRFFGLRGPRFSAGKLF